MTYRVALRLNRGIAFTPDARADDDNVTVLR